MPAARDGAALPATPVTRNLENADEEAAHQLRRSRSRRPGSRRLGTAQGRAVANRRVTAVGAAPVQAKVEAKVAARPAEPGVRIRIDALGKRYGTLEVFREISLDVGDREIVAIVGPS